MKKIFILFFIYIGVGLLSCKVSSDLERHVHPEDWLNTHYLQVQNAGDQMCMECHPPDGNYPEAPSCASCHPTSN